MDEGFVIIHRKILTTPVYQKPELFHLFIHCILRANYKSRKVYVGGSVVDVKPGQFITGRDKFAKEVGSSPSTVWYRLKLLEKMEYIDINSTATYSLISVNNFSLYQHPGNFRQVVDHGLTGFRQALDTDNKENKGTREENMPISPEKETPGRRKSVQYEKIRELYNEISGPHFGVRKALAKKDRQKIYAVNDILEKAGLTFDQFFKKISASDFLRRSAGPGKWANFDWIFTEGNAIKIISGNYDNAGSPGNEHRPDKRISEGKKNAILHKYEQMRREDPDGAERYRQSSIRLDGYDPKLDKEV